MKYKGFILLAIVFFICSLGINLYSYYEELLEKGKEEQRESEEEEKIEGFAISQSGIMLDGSGKILLCSTPQKSQNGGKCMDLSYIDQNGQIKSGVRAVIYPNYYVDPASGMLQPVPYGYKANAQQTGYYANSTIALIETSNNTFTPPPKIQDTNPSTNYSASSSVQYNKGYKPADDSNGLPPGKMYFPNGDGTVSVVDIATYDQSTRYYETGTYNAGPRNFVPNYEPTGFLSTLGSQNIQDYKNKDPIYLAGAPIDSVSYKDLDTLYSKDPARLEAACNAMDPFVCASSTSCALLGGQKCVSADANGPIMKSNYSDYLITNRDYYYYQGKCYGMCPPIPTTPAPTTVAPTTAVPTTVAPTTPAPTTIAPTAVPTTAVPTTVGSSIPSPSSLIPSMPSPSSVM